MKSTIVSTLFTTALASSHAQHAFTIPSRNLLEVEPTACGLKARECFLKYEINKVDYISANIFKSNTCEDVDARLEYNFEEAMDCMYGLLDECKADDQYVGLYRGLSRSGHCSSVNKDCPACDKLEEKVKLTKDLFHTEACDSALKGCASKITNTEEFNASLEALEYGRLCKLDELLEKYKYYEAVTCLQEENVLETCKHSPELDDFLDPIKYFSQEKECETCKESCTKLQEASEAVEDNSFIAFKDECTVSTRACTSLWQPELDDVPITENGICKHLQQQIDDGYLTMMRCLGKLESEKCEDSQHLKNIKSHYITGPYYSLCRNKWVGPEYAIGCDSECDQYFKAEKEIIGKEDAELLAASFESSSTARSYLSVFAIGVSFAAVCSLQN